MQMGAKQRKRWTPEEDDAVRLAVREGGDSGDKVREHFNALVSVQRSASSIFFRMQKLGFAGHPAMVAMDKLRYQDLMRGRKERKAEQAESPAPVKKKPQARPVLVHAKDSEWIFASEAAKEFGYSDSGIRLMYCRGDVRRQIGPGGHFEYNRADIAARVAASRVVMPTTGATATTGETNGHRNGNGHGKVAVDDKTMARIRYELDGVEIGARTLEEAHAAIRKLVATS